MHVIMMYHYFNILTCVSFQKGALLGVLNRLNLRAERVGVNSCYTGSFSGPGFAGWVGGERIRGKNMKNTPKCWARRTAKGDGSGSLFFSVKVGLTYNEVCEGYCPGLVAELTVEELEVDVARLLVEPPRATGG